MSSDSAGGEHPGGEHAGSDQGGEHAGGEHAGSPAVARWLELLAARVGMSAPEIAARRRDLLAFCEVRKVAPEELLARWAEFPELTVRRDPAAAAAPNLAVESFLIHNGVNVFGDIVCVAGRPDDLATQGAWFTAAARSREEAS